MTLFEYLAIAFSLVFSFTAMRLISGLPHAFDRERRYWIHLFYVGFNLFLTTAAFWAFWNFRDVSWSLPRFLLVLTATGLLYFLACLLVPESPSLVESWRDYFHSIRRRYFVGTGAYILVGVIMSTLLIGLPWNHPARALQLYALTGAVMGTAFSGERAQGMLAGLYFPAGALAIALFFGAPASLVND